MALTKERHVWQDPEARQRALIISLVAASALLPQDKFSSDHPTGAQAGTEPKVAIATSPNESETKWVNDLVKKVTLVDEAHWRPDNPLSVRNDLFVIATHANDLGVPPERVKAVLKKLVVFENNQNYDRDGKEINTIRYDFEQKEWHLTVLPESPRSVAHEFGHALCSLTVDTNQTYPAIWEACAESFSRKLGLGTGFYDPEVASWQQFEKDLLASGKLRPKDDLTIITIQIASKWITAIPGKDRDGQIMPNDYLLGQYATRYGVPLAKVKEIGKKHPLLWR